MLRTGWPLRLPWAVWLGFVAASIAVGAVTALLSGGDGRAHFTGVPVLRLPPLPAPPPPAPEPAADGPQAERQGLRATTLTDKGLVPAAVSALVIGRAGLSAGFGNHGQTASRSQG